MSAYTDGRSIPLVSITRTGLDQDLGEIGNLSDKFENFVSIIKNLENGLNQERVRSRKLRDDWSRAHEIHEQTVRELESRVREYSFQETRLKSKIKEQEITENDFKSKLSAIELEFQKSKEELNQYKSSWAEVLQREREAKMVLLDGEQIKKTLADVEARCKRLEEELATEKNIRSQFERHSKSYQMELQNTLVRLHSSEAKYSELHKQLEVMQSSRKSIEEEVASMEKSLKERFQWENAKELEHSKAVLERENAIDREKYREELRAKFEAIHHHEIQNERARIEKQRLQFEEERATLLKELEDSRRGYSEKLIESQTQSEKIRQDSIEKLTHAQLHLETIRTELEERIRESQNRAEVLRSDLSSQLIEAQRQLSESQTEAKQARALVQIERELNQNKLQNLESEITELKHRASQSDLKSTGAINELESTKRRVGKLISALRAKTAAKRRSLTAAQEKYHRDAIKWEGLEQFVLDEKNRFHRALIGAEAELRKIRIDHPLKGLLARHQIRVENCEDPVVLEGLMQEYLEIKNELEASEISIDRQIEEIQAQRDKNTILAGPAAD